MRLPLRKPESAAPQIGRFMPGGWRPLRTTPGLRSAPCFSQTGNHSSLPILLLLLFLPAVHGFVAPKDAQGRLLRWDLSGNYLDVHTNMVNRVTHRVRYFVAWDAYSAAHRSNELNAVHASFDQWAAVPGTALQFEFGGYVAPGIDVNVEDNTNVVYWAKTSTLVNGELDNISGSLAVTFPSYFDDNTLAGVDLVLNGIEFTWTTQPQAGARSQSIEATVLHEIGHFIGLYHTPVGGATLFHRGEYGINLQEGLTSDDMAAVRTLYPQPAFMASLASVQGFVRSGGQPLFGAIVSAENAAGNVAQGTISRADGSYELTALPPGNYLLRVSPLDPPGGQPLLSGYDIYWEFDNVQTGFLPPSPLPIILAGGQILQQDLSVILGQPELRIGAIRPPTATPDRFTGVAAPVTIQPGQSNLIVGVYSSAPFPADATLWVTGDGLSLGQTSTGSSFLPSPYRYHLSVQISVTSQATPGLRSLIVRRGADVAIAHGFLEVLGPYQDYNFDGLDDSFQRRYFPLFTGPQAAPGFDPDGDGFRNIDEYIAGTIPTNALSFLRVVEAKATPQGLSILWQGMAGKRYQLLTRPSLLEGQWQPVSEPFMATNDLVQFLVAPAASPAGFYRLIAVPLEN